MSHAYKVAGIILLAIALAAVILSKATLGIRLQEWVLEVVRYAACVLGVSGLIAIATGFNFYPLKWRIPALNELFPNIFPR